jgi:hypothetical protein
MTNQEQNSTDVSVFFWFRKIFGKILSFIIITNSLECNDDY